MFLGIKLYSGDVSSWQIDFLKFRLKYDKEWE